MDPGGPCAPAQLLWILIFIYFFFTPHPPPLEARHSNERANLKKNQNNTTKTSPSSADTQSVFRQLALFLLLRIKNKDRFNGAVQTCRVAFVQGSFFLLFGLFMFFFLLSSLGRTTTRAENKK